MGQTPEHAVCRLTCESTLLATHEPGGLGPGLGAYRGFGQVGADYWPVLEDPGNKRVRHRIDARYVPCGSLGLSDTFYALLAPGKSMPAHSCRSQLMRESQQEAEARVLVQDALLDETRKARLGTELAKECQEICDQRSRIFLYSAIYFGEAGNEYGRVFNQERWDVLTERLYVAAGKVIKAADK